jgi:hypothetical protein
MDLRSSLSGGLQVRLAAPVRRRLDNEIRLLLRLNSVEHCATGASAS